jgi:alcohol dehydrogenase (NADP+)
MLPTRGYAAHSPTSKLESYKFERRDVGPKDVLIEIKYSGICHSDIHSARDEWGGAVFPMVPGHEIVGLVKQVGNQVKHFKTGDIAGVGCFVESCRVCEPCKSHEQQFCEKLTSFTYNSTLQDGKTRTYGGYSNQIVADEDYVLKIPNTIPLERAAPLLCAGITTYSPMKHYKVGKGQKVGVVGLGGLGHMAVKIAVAMGADVTVFSTSPKKESDAKELGAQHFVVTKDPKNLEPLAKKFHFIIDTVSAQHDLNTYLELLGRGGVMCLVGVPEKPAEVAAHNLIMRRRTLAGSLIGGIKETQEMLNFCAERNIAADVEVIPAQKINEAFDRTVKGDVHYRFVIDASTF